MSTKDLEQPILDIVLTLNHQELITKLEIDKERRTICDFIAKEVRYHMCRVELQSRAEQKRYASKNSIWHEVRDVHAIAFDAIKDFVQKTIINNEEAHFMKDLVLHYHSVMVDVGGPAYDDVIFTTQHLEDKLTTFFGKIIMFDNGNKKRGNIIYNAKTNLQIAVRKAFDSGGEVTEKVREVAFLLRKEIISSKKRSLPATITLPDIYR